MKIGIILLLTCCLPISAQNNMQANVDLQFRFANPGARAQAMGGAFIGLADDTTAIFANPAGLIRLTGTTLALEGNSTSRDNPIPFYSGTIDQKGLQDFDFNLQTRQFSDDQAAIPFMAYVNGERPFKWGVFYAEQANFQREFSTLGVGIPPSTDRLVQINTLQLLPPSSNRVDLSLRALGFSFAAKLGERLALGATLSYQQMDYRAQTTFFFPDIEALFPDLNFDPRQVDALRPFIGEPINLLQANGKDEALAAYVGLMFTPDERFSVGVAYKSQPSFDYSYDTQSRDDNFDLQAPSPGAGSFNVPDNWGVGFSFRPTELFLISVEVNRVLYSDLSDDYQVLLPDDRDPIRAGQVAPDVTEYHVGCEYFITSLAFPLALRAGYWLEPYHALTNTTSDTQLLFRFEDESGTTFLGSRQAPFLQRFERDENHLTFGLGLTLGQHMTVDLAGDFADETQIISLSGIYRF